MNKAKQKQKQTIVGLVTAIICLLMFTTAMTFAYFTARNSAESTAMQFGTLEISVDNVGVSKEAEHELMPGCTVSLAGEVTLGNSTIDAFVRIKPEVNITAWSGTSLTEVNAELQLSNLIIGAFEKEVNSTKTGDFIRATGDNTYLYYTGKFAHDATYDFGTHNIAFTIDANTFGNDWQGCTFTVKITAEAIQADHVGVTLTGTKQTDVDAIAGAKANNETDSAWNGVSGNNQEEQNNALAEASLQYLSFTPVNADGSAISGATTLSESANEMPTLNGGKVTASNLMADGTKFVSVKSKTDVNQATGDIAIPEYIKVESNEVVLATRAEWESGDAYKVIKIAEEAFFKCTSLESITIPNSVTSIGQRAFYLCSGLTSITIPNSVTSIGNSAFESCGLTSITIPSSIKILEGYAFHSCGSLTTIYFNANLDDYKEKHGPFTWVGNSENGATIVIGSNVTRIPAYFLSDCYDSGYSDYITSIVFEENSTCTSIGESAFSTCHITSINLPSTIETIENYAFGGTGLTSITIPNSVTSIESGTFSGCESLTSITIPSSVTSIGESAFYQCTSLASITIPNSVTSIGVGAFEDCTSLTSITIPSGVTSIGERAFAYCSGLTSVTFDNPNGWQVSSSSDMSDPTALDSNDLSNTSTAATYLKSTYADKYWAS